MILYCSYEELSALSAGTARVLAEESDGTIVVAAPPQIVADLEALEPRLIGDIALLTLTDQRSIARAVAFVAMDLRQRMDIAVISAHPAGEMAVQAYFEYAHVLMVEDRLRRIGAQMVAMIELMTGAPPTEETAQIIAFPD